jgi:hypothetical protein
MLQQNDDKRRERSHGAVIVAHARAAACCAGKRPLACKDETCDEDFDGNAGGRGAGTCLNVEETEVACSRSERQMQILGGSDIIPLQDSVVMPP